MRMESAVGMQLRSKASPADSIILSATLHRTEWAVPSAVGRDVGVPCWDGRQAVRLEVCANLPWAKAGIVNILGSLELVALCQLHTHPWSDTERTIKSSVNSETCNLWMAFNGPRNIKPSLWHYPHSDTDISMSQLPQPLCTRLKPDLSNGVQTLK